jgi:hypothetical protein
VLLPFQLFPVIELAQKNQDDAPHETAPLPLLVLAGTLSLHGAPYISKFMASNSHILSDEDGDFPDWIEIHTPTLALLKPGLTTWATTQARTPFPRLR